MLQVLAGPGKAYLRDTQRLKYLLAPVVCRNAAEQERFYEVVDRFLVERGEVSVEGPSGHGGDRFAIWWRSLRDWVKFGFLGVLGLGAFLIWSLGGENKPPPLLQMEQPFEIALGDTLFLRNTTENQDTHRYRTFWELYGYDPAGRETLLASDSVVRDWAVPVDTIGEIPALWAHLKAVPLKKGDTLAIDRRIRVNCTDMPPEVQIIAPGTADPGQQLRFSFSGTIDPKLRYRWIFEGKDTLEAATAQRAFPEPGPQTVALLIDRPGAAGYCQREIYHNIQIGPDKVRLEALPLLKAPQEPHWTFAIGTWLLLGILGLAVLLTWLKWMKRSKDSPAPQPNHPTTQQPRFASTDRAPYFIPFRSRNELIRPAREPLRLAEVLRRRQEGLRLEVDVPASVKATIARGGFPVFRQRYNTQPVDYLFLVDEQSPVSHQARLFQYLVGMLREQDIHMQVFFFRGEPGRVWNADFPGGLALEQVQRHFPLHRLVVMGEGHGMLDPHATGQHQIRAGLMATFLSWKQRILLTPLPPRSWGFQEAALQRHFVVFPADLQGMTEAATYLEAGLDTGDLPLTFKAWKEQLETPRRDADPLFRRWRTAAAHSDYLEGRPDLFRWLCATAVYPKPTWELTIAIGQALGMRMSYDDLLILSRISWLQDGNLHPRLREELLAFVTPADERLARQAVRDELAAVAELAAHGAANQELQVNIAIQDFALESENPEFQDTIRQLLDAGLLSRRQEAELDEVVRKKQTITQNNIGSKYAEEKAPGIRDILKEKSPPTQPPNNPSPPRLALALTAFWLLLFAVLWLMIDRNTLDKRFPPTEKQRHFFFVKEAFYIDSALIYNNQGVDTFYADPVRGLRSTAFFEKAAGLPVADTNLLKLYYNLGVQQYDSLLQTPNTNHQSPTILFRKALPLPDALHGIGLTHYYQENRDSARFYFERLLAQTDSLFFDTTSVFPNLETLLFPDRPSEIRDVKITETRDGGLEVWVAYYHNVRLNPRLSLEVAPLLANGKVPAGFARVAKDLSGGAGEVVLKILINNQKLAINTTQIRLRLWGAEDALVGEQDIVYSFTWGKIQTNPIPSNPDQVLVLKDDADLSPQNDIRKGDYTKDFKFFTDKKEQYQHWLDSKGLGHLLKVNDIKVEPQRVSLYLAFMMEDVDSIRAAWYSTKNAFEATTLLTLEQELFYHMTQSFEVRQTQADVQIYDTYDLMKDPLFFRGIYFENGRVQVDSKDPKFFTPDEFMPEPSMFQASGKTLEVYHKFTQDWVYEKIYEYSEGQFSSKTCNKHQSKISLKTVGEVLQFEVYDICGEVFYLETKPGSEWCKTLGSLGIDCNKTIWERLFFTIVYTPTDKGFKLNVNIDGKYSVGKKNPPNQADFVDMEIDFDPYIEFYHIRFIEEIKVLFVK